MPRVTDQQDRATVVRETPGLEVHLRHQRARGIDHPETALGSSVVHRRRDTVGREHHDRPLRHFGLLLDEDRALAFQVFDDVQVMHDLLPHVDGGAVLHERALDRVDRALHARAVPARRREQHRSVIHIAMVAGRRVRADLLPTR